MQLSFHFTLQGINLKYLNLLQLMFSVPASFDPEKKTYFNIQTGFQVFIILI